jgi:hypothetical protein
MAHDEFEVAGPYSDCQRRTASDHEREYAGAIQFPSPNRQLQDGRLDSIPRTTVMPPRSTAAPCSAPSRLLCGSPSEP